MFKLPAKIQIFEHPDIRLYENIEISYFLVTIEGSTTENLVIIVDDSDMLLHDGFFIDQSRRS